MEDSRGRGRGNPWNRGRGRGQNQNYSGRKKPGPDKSSETKFQEAHARHQASLQKHIKQDYESSSEEEELESDNILCKLHSIMDLP